MKIIHKRDVSWGKSGTDIQYLYSANYTGLTALMNEFNIPHGKCGKSCYEDRNWISISSDDATEKTMEDLEDRYIKKREAECEAQLERVEGNEAFYMRVQTLSQGHGHEEPFMSPDWALIIYTPTFSQRTRKLGYIDLRKIKPASFVRIEVPSDWYLGWCIGPGGSFARITERKLSDIFGMKIKVKFKKRK